MRSVNLHVTSRAVVVLSVQIVLRSQGLVRANAMSHAVASKTELRDRAESQQPRIGRAVRRVTRRATFGLQRRVFIRERTLFVSVTLNTSRIGARCQSRLLELKATVRIVAITALHRPFEHLVMEGLVKIRFSFRVAAHAELRLSNFQQVNCGEARLLSIRRSHARDGAWHIFRSYDEVR